MICACDTNAIIYLFDKRSEFYSSSLEFFQAARAGKLEVYASELVLVEFLSHKSIADDVVQEIKQDLLNLPIRYKPLDQAMLMRTAQLRRKHKIKLPDAMHLASALEIGSQNFITNDQKLLKQKIPGIKLVPLTKVTSS